MDQLNYLGNYRRIVFYVKTWTIYFTDPSESRGDNNVSLPLENLSDHWGGLTNWGMEYRRVIVESIMDQIGPKMAFSRFFLGLGHCKNSIRFMHIKCTIFIYHQILFCFLLLFFLYFLHQYTLSITMELGLILIDTF